MLLLYKQYLNEAFNDALQNSSITTPVKPHNKQYSEIAEHLNTDDSVLRRGNEDLKGVIHRRKERLSSKRLVLKGKFIVSTEEIQKNLADAEKKTR